MLAMLLASLPRRGDWKPRLLAAYALVNRHGAKITKPGRNY
jgi:hypothetical protein